MEQWLARWAHNPKAGGSNPPPATNFLVTALYRRGIEQWLARRAHNPEVAGSNPVPAILCFWRILCFTRCCAGACGQFLGNLILGPASCVLRVAAQVQGLGFGEAGLLAAVQAFEGVCFAQPVVGIVGAQANGFIGGTQGFIVAA